MKINEDEKFYRIIQKGMNLEWYTISVMNGMLWKKSYKENEMKYFQVYNKK
jgi:hypothetical protein